MKKIEILKLFLKNKKLKMTNVSAGLEITSYEYPFILVVDMPIGPADLELILNAPKFTEWVKGEMKQVNTKIKTIAIKYLKKFGPNVGFVGIELEYTDKMNPKAFPTVVFISGHASSVLIKVINSETSDEYAGFVVQNRPAACNENLTELLAGMLDNNPNTPLNTALKELGEEFGIADIRDGKVEGSSLKHLGEFYTSPGRSDEKIIAYYLELKKTSAEINTLNGSKTGQRHEGEAITVVLHPWNEAYLHTNDCKYFSSMFLLSKMK